MTPPEAPTRLRARIRFTKLDDLRWIGHRDLMRVWERLFRRAGVSLSMTEGFHPKPRINFPSALAVGIAGTDELVEVDFAASYTAEQLREIVTPELPPGMTLGAIEILPGLDRKAQVNHVTFTLEIPPARQMALAERLAWLMTQTSLPITREGRAKPLDLRPLVDKLELVELPIDDSGAMPTALCGHDDSPQNMATQGSGHGTQELHRGNTRNHSTFLHLRLRVDREGSARPREVLEQLQIADLEFEGYFLTRTRVEIE